MKRVWILAAAVAAVSATTFDQAEPGYRYEFPRDHFQHPSFRSEWWYYTGNLSTASGRKFGFELTFFRQRLERDEQVAGAWDPEQVYLAHWALTDVRGRRLWHVERVNRAGPGLAGASRELRTIWNGNWSVEYLPGDPRMEPQRLRAVAEDASLELSLRPLKPAVIHGEDGISRKAGGRGSASHYVSFTRLAASGTIILDGSEHAVEGSAWMDHEFFTSSLAPDQVGWDWLSVQLGDGTDLMIYGLRSASGAHDRFSSGTFVDTAGRTTHLQSGEFTLMPGRTWSSDRTGGRYPVEWTVQVPGLGLRLEVRPLLDDQEIVSPHGLSPNYWEGAVTYSGERSGRPVEGVGYLEMTGYDKPIRLGLGFGSEREPTASPGGS